MSSDSETQVPLEAFHRHFLVTHLKGNADRLLDRLEERARRSGEPFGPLLADLVASCCPQGGYLDNDWHVREVPVDMCYFAHTDFRSYRVPKGHRFVEFLDNQVQEIERGSFPCSSQIRALWSEVMPEPLVQERGRGTGKYYVLDGQLRVIRHWYHQIPNVRVFIYRGNLDV
jgi:hypothetical protein